MMFLYSKILNNTGIKMFDEKIIKVRGKISEVQDDLSDIAFKTKIDIKRRELDVYNNLLEHIDERLAALA